jgi:very-short-patch-repair endonuclease
MPKLPKALSEGEETFALHCRANGLTPEREYQFSKRGWMFDFCWPRQKIAVEIDGGTKFGLSRHSRGDGYENDCRKLNAAAQAEWLVFRFTSEMVKSGEAINVVRKALACQ